MAEQKEEKKPKVFISYSWSSQEHEDWVLSLAKDLMHAGVNVLFDKWDLKPGHDTNAFMEQMVNDPSLDNVLIISDKAYADKANNRKGGVGTEALIISPEMYSDHKQDKFIPIIPSKDEAGKACLPTYCASRLWIDLSDQNEYSTNFDNLLRLIYKQPSLPKPELGKKPSFLDDTKQIDIGTSGLYRRLMDAINNGKPNLSGTLTEYLTTFSENLERFKINDWDRETYDDQIVESIDLFIPARNEFLQVMIAIAQYCPTQENIQKVHGFLESLFPYMDSHISPNGGGYCEYMSDNFKFIIHELFLYIVAILIKYEQFELVNYFFINSYYYANPLNSNKRLFSFNKLWSYLRSLDDYRNHRLLKRRLSIHADLIKDRATFKSIKFEDLMQADLVIFIRACQLDYHYWPITLVYSRGEDIFEIFARSSSKNYFNKMKKLFDVSTVDEFKQIKLVDIKCDHWPLALELITNKKNLCSQP